MYLRVRLSVERHIHEYQVFHGDKKSQAARQQAATEAANSEHRSYIRSEQARATSFVAVIRRLFLRFLVTDTILVATDSSFIKSLTMPYQSASSLVVVVGAFNVVAGLLYGVDLLTKGVRQVLSVLRISCLGAFRYLFTWDENDAVDLSVSFTVLSWPWSCRLLQRPYFSLY